MQKNTCFSISNFRFFSAQKRAACVPAALKNDSEVEIVEKYAQIIDFSGEKVLSKNKNSTCKKKLTNAKKYLFFSL